jgi:hypothetical protein
MQFVLAVCEIPRAGFLEGYSYSSVPHSMADERTMSAVTLLNTAQPNRQLVPQSSPWRKFAHTTWVRDHKG